MLSDEKINSIVARADDIMAQMAESPEPEIYVKLSKEFSDLEPVVNNIRELKAAQNEFADLAEMLTDGDTDAEMKEMAEAEMPELREKIDALVAEIQVQLLPKDIADKKNAIVEVRAGTGGDEAALFAGDLFRMYERYAAVQGWKFNVMTMNDGDVGGFKEAVANISGEGVFARLKFESGVHRVQRVPETESGGRVHTSAATVAVLPEAEEVDIEIRNEDIRIDTMRASGAGGQHVNTTDSAVRITHEPSGIVVTSSE
ncbi:MAG: PCRF domain-containing protein, partial [Hyphomicrobiales bacterium]